MELTLFYRGSLKANGDAGHKHDIRRVFAPQIRRRIPFLAAHQIIHRVEGEASLSFCAPITRANGRTAELNITLLRPSAPGEIIQHGGDIDNRLKTLFDALRCPTIPEVPPAARAEIQQAANPLGLFCCLMEDDALVSALAIRTDRLLDVDPAEKPNEVVLVIHVRATTHVAI